MARNFTIRIFWILAVLLLLAGPFVGLAAKNVVERGSDEKPLWQQGELFG